MKCPQLHSVATVLPQVGSELYQRHQRMTRHVIVRLEHAYPVATLLGSPLQRSRKPTKAACAQLPAVLSGHRYAEGRYVVVPLAFKRGLAQSHPSMPLSSLLHPWRHACTGGFPCTVERDVHVRLVLRSTTARRRSTTSPGTISSARARSSTSVHDRRPSAPST